MNEHRLAQATVVATFLLLVVGGLVHSTGSSLSCPDWPLCYGQFFPAMEGGVLFEHGHRLVALAVVGLTGSLAVAVFRRRRGTAVRALASASILLVLVQASLGAVTVLWKLPVLVSSAHLATSMAFFLVVVALSHRLAPAPASAAAAPGPVRLLAGLAALGVYLQIVLGALVRHSGSGLACGTEAVLCQGVVWPLGGPAELQMLHRMAGVVAALLATAAGLLALRHGGTRARRAAALAPLLALLQLGLGAWTVWSLIAVPVVSLHLAVGALLLADTLSLFLALGPARTEATADRTDPAAGLVPARSDA
ncbi:MAG TPA: COX15/CtaA family protein [Anaeromyxobacteraceae bacterium]|nr:COX15/CtaA family protein [Anaeromyxobacteraceae bacterium]